jgi:transcriptional regulator with XRE-family HTH domain
MKFAEILFELRKKHNLSLRDLGKKSGVDHAYISRLERGGKTFPSFSVIRKLAEAMSLSIFDLQVFCDAVIEQECEMYKKNLISDCKKIVYKHIKYSSDGISYKD